MNRIDNRMNRIDAHIHLDLFEPKQQAEVFKDFGVEVESVIAVSMDLPSCQKNLELARQYSNAVYPAFGFHPEQKLPTEEETNLLMDWIVRHEKEAVAIGEVGLPYYTRREAEKRGESFDLVPYIELLDRFVRLAVGINKPIVLHAVYEDADIACDLLERSGCGRAHFHWFKGAEKTVDRMVERGCYISITPDIRYEDEIRELVRRYPIDLLMAETDGPWLYEGPYVGQLTRPGMIRHVVEEIAKIRGLSFTQTEEYLYRNTKRFYVI